MNAFDRSPESIVNVDLVSTNINPCSWYLLSIGEQDKGVDEWRCLQENFRYDLLKYRRRKIVRKNKAIRQQTNRELIMIK